MSAPTCQAVGLSLLRDRGILSFSASGPQANLCRPTDVTDTALCITAALQEIALESASEQLGQPASFYLRAPTTVTLTATQGSKTISALTTYDGTWMPGCTIRINGDTQDNELLNATTLTKPFVGASGSAISATVYHDCLTVGSDVEKIIGPLMLEQSRFVTEATSRTEFIQRCWYATGSPNQAGPWLGFVNAPFWSFGPKPIDQFPSVFFLDTYYDPTLDYVPRRIRLSPMPAVAQAIAWTNKMTPLRVTAADIVSPLTTLVASGAGDASANQSYVFNCDVNGYRYFAGVTHPLYSIFFHPGLNLYVIVATLNASATPTAYWTSDLGTSPLGTFTPAGTATGTVTVTTTDSGGGAADPGTKLPIPDGWVESILLCVARRRGASLATFHNAEIRAAIEEDYQRALRILRGTVISSKPAKTRYV